MMRMGFDLNTVQEEERGEEGAVKTGSSSSVCMELWRACAGPPICLPERGSVVVYLPQGHLEHVGVSAPLPGVPAHVFCRVVAVHLHVCEASFDFLEC